MLLPAELTQAQDTGRLTGFFFSLHFIFEMRLCGSLHCWLLGSVMLIGAVSSVTGEVALTHQRSSGEPSGSEHGPASNITGIPIVTFKWHHVETPYLVALWVLVPCLGKMGT